MENITVRDFIYIAGFMITIFSVFFSRKDRSENKIEKAIKDLKDELKKDIDLLFQKLDNTVEEKFCAERRANIKEDINGLGDLIRGK